MGELMQFVKKAAVHAGAVIKGILFTGYSIQSVLGLIWLCCNFMQVQDFGKPDSVLYRQIFGLLGGSAGLLYLVQLAAAFGAGYFILRGVFLTMHIDAFPYRRFFLVWGSFALLTFPFAMQCHLAILPHSFMGSLFLLLISFLLPTQRGIPGKGWKKCLCRMGGILLCIGLMTALSGAADADKRNTVPGRSFAACLASRVAWPNLWTDYDWERWPEDLRVIVGGVVEEAASSPDNMRILQETIEGQVSAGKAEEYYLQIAGTGWEYHSYMVIRQIGWDLLGYMVTPVIVPIQLEGGAYDSYTGRNYEIMRGNAPVLTKYYVEYACWWFACSMVLAAALVPAGIVVRLAEKKDRQELKWKEGIRAACICVFTSGILVIPLTMRGSGVMDYKYTAAVNELWLVWIFLLMVSCPPGGARSDRNNQLEMSDDKRKI